jgi:hypothetical protein
MSEYFEEELSKVMEFQENEEIFLWKNGSIASKAPSEENEESEKTEVVKHAIVQDEREE